MFTPAEKAAIKWAEVLTEKTYRGENPQAMPALKEHYSDAQIVEITMVSCTFNFWNRFTDSLQIDIEEAPVMARFTKSKTIDPGRLCHLHVRLLVEQAWCGRSRESGGIVISSRRAAVTTAVQVFLYSISSATPTVSLTLVTLCSKPSPTS